jgi:FKBP-type peptidyl-prolyl cis-trans isomerase FkpA/FKBP-type peptidyl-prolyl cis-trans isomerase FklB
MSPNFRLLALCACASLLFACAKKEAPTAVELNTDAQKFGYAIGIDLGNSLKPVSTHVDVTALKQGLDDVGAAHAKIDTAKKALEASPNDEKLKKDLEEAQKMPGLKLDEAAREAIKTSVAKTMQEEQLKQREEQAAKATEEGTAFLAENAKKAGVKTTASGLQYEVLTEGSGDSPKATDEVTVHYRGTLINGEEFDSSIARGQPVTFPLGNVIPGWTEGVQLMKPGAKYKFYIPSSLGYGERGAGVKIGPNQTLIFEVELISVGKPKEEKK